MEKHAIQGGEFLVRKSNVNEVFIPEEFDEEQRMIHQTCVDFLEAEVFPKMERIDKQEPGLMPEVLRKAGELGLLGISIPEEYGGFGQSFITSMLVSEALGAAGSFSVGYSAHTGIGTLPIMYYGNDQQKEKYLPMLASGEWLGAYCLTEPGAGSDANSGKTKAVLNEEGTHYILNGQKMWITNGGFADVLTVFAKIDNDRVLSAFIVERNFPGITFNPEEKKMGIKGSSTVQIFFNDCQVPVENMLGKRGDGFRIALNILNLGRIKLGGNVLGAAKRAITQSVRYANERKQFGKLISTFGSIKHKLAEQSIRTFASESIVYRTSQNIEETAQDYIKQGMEKGQANVEAQRNFAVEAAITKVHASETLDYVVDEGVQIHGGMGYSAETEIETSYRDARINRIFEGSNEINRLVVADTMLKKGAKKEIDIYEEAAKLKGQLAALKPTTFDNDYYTRMHQYVQGFKKATILLSGAVHDYLGRKIADEQEVMNSLADMMMELYAAASVLLRVEKLEGMNGAAKNELQRAILDVLVYESASRIFKAGKDAIYNTFDNEEEQNLLLKGLTIYTDVKGVNCRNLRRQLADKLIEENVYCF